MTLREAALESKFIDAKQFHEIVAPKSMTRDGLNGAWWIDEAAHRLGCCICDRHGDRLLAYRLCENPTDAMIPLLNRGGMMKGFVQRVDRQQTTLLALAAGRPNSMPVVVEMDASLPSVIVCLRSIQKTPAIIDVENRVSAEHARDSGHSTPAIRKTPALRPPGRAGPAPTTAAPSKAGE